MLVFCPPGGNTWGFFMLPDKYHKDSVDANVDACYAVIRPLYELYSGVDIAEAHFRIRKELDMIIEVEEKRRKIKKLQAELADNTEVD